MEMRTTFYPRMDLEMSLEPDHGLHHHYPKSTLPPSTSPSTRHPDGLLLPYLYSNIPAIESQGNPNPIWDNVSTNVNQIGRALALNSSFDAPPETGGYVESQTMEEIVSVVVPIIFGLIVIVGLFGNALVVIVVMCNPQMRSTTNLLIINLAIADLLFIVFCVPFTAWDYAFPHWIFGDVWCRLVQYLIVVCAFASIYTLVLMSLDRFLAVVHPVASISIRTQRNASMAIVLTWITILLTCSPALIAHGEQIYDFQGTQYSQCNFKEEYNKKLYYSIFFLSSYIVPITIVFVLYLLMLNRLWFGAVPGGRMSSESVRSKKRVTRLVVVVVLVFAGCWCPIQVVLLLKAFNWWTMDSLHLVIQIIAHVLAYMNSCVNPILYAFLSENFRKAFFKVIACGNVNELMPERTRPGQSEIGGGITVGGIPTTAAMTASVAVAPEQIEMSTIKKVPLTPRRLSNPLNGSV